MLKRVFAKCLSIFLALCLLVPICNILPADSELKIITYNILYAESSLDVAVRKSKIFSYIKDEAPDAIGFQEINGVWEADADRILTNMNYVRIGISDFAKDDPNYGARFSAYIYYNKDSLRVGDSGAFSISDNPSDLHAFFSDMDDEVKWKQEGRPRNANWAVFTVKSTGKKFLMVNTHLPWAGGYNEKGQKVLAEQINLLNKKYNLPLIVTGDLNASDVSDIMNPTGLKSANTGFATYAGGSSLDHCLYSPEDFILKGCAVGTDATASDHLPIAASFTLKGNPYAK